MKAKKILIIGFLFLIASCLLPNGFITKKELIYNAGKLNTPAALQTIAPKNVQIDTTALKSSNWYKQVVKNIEKNNYHIRPATPKNHLTLINSAQKITAQITPASLLIKKQSDKNNGPQLELNLKGIFTKKSVFLPVESLTASYSENKAVFNHNYKFSVEYENTEAGIRQNFILHRPPEENVNQVSVMIDVDKQWFINQPHPGELHFAEEKNGELENFITYNSLKVWDANQKPLEAAFSKNNSGFSINVNTENAIYPITIDPLSTTANTTLQSNVAGAFFGRSLASAGDVNGDGYSDVVIGAAGYANGQSFEGAMYVYHGSATGLSTTPSTTIESNQANATYGYSVNTAGDVNGDGYSDIIVGSHLYDNGETNEGRIYIYHGSAAGINITPAVIIESNQAQAAFGVSVACAGDVNNDGYSDIIVGAQTYDNGQNDEGAAFIYHGSATGINSTAAVVIEANLANSFMGVSVAGAGDVNGDGISDIIIGARSYADGESEEGHVFIHHGSATGIVITPATTLQVNQVQAQLGMFVSTAGDVNGDGYSDIIAGAHFYDNGQIQEGAAFIHHGSATGISSAAAIVLESNQADAYFGATVNCIGDVNGDGFSEIAVGALLYDNGELNEGSVFVYSGSATGINTTPIATYESNQDNAEFSSIASGGDVNGDGYSDMIAGSYRYDNGETDEGNVFVYHGSPNNLSTSHSWAYETNEDNAEMGDVTFAGDVNADGYSDVLVAIEEYDGGTSNIEMTVQAYYGTANGLPATPSWSYRLGAAPIPSISLYCNTVGDVNGDGYSDIMIGMPFNSNGETYEGQVVAFYGSATGLPATPNWSFESNIVGVHSGASIAGAGDVNGDGYGDAVIGASANNGSVIARVYLFYGSATGMAATPGWSYLNSAFPGSYFGTSVASAGDINGDGYSDIIVGADRGTFEPNYYGQVYIFNGSALGPGATYNQLIQENTYYSLFGGSVASAGDVNGDGFSDVIVGAFSYEDGETDEGRAYIYHGSSSGLNAIPAWTTESNQASALYGIQVSSAGDINGDGYSDVIIGAMSYDNGQTNEGSVFIYTGSQTGLSLTPVTILESNQANASFGASLCAAGDVNGDGYSDILSAAPGYSNGQANEGRVYLFYGAGLDGLRNNLRLYNMDLVTPIQRVNIAEPNLFGAGLFTKSPIGRSSGRLTWEVRAQGLTFSGLPVTNSTSYSGRQPTWIDLGIAGTELKYQVPKTGFQNKVRARAEYNKAKAITGQVYGPWRYPAGYQQGGHGMNSIPLPIKLHSFAGTAKDNNDIQLQWITENEVNVTRFVIERSLAGLQFVPIATVAATGASGNRSYYQFTDTTKLKTRRYYRLRIIENDNRFSFSKTISFAIRQTPISIYPNPAISNSIINIQFAENGSTGIVRVELYNISGQRIANFSTMQNDGDIKIKLPALLLGMYQVRIFSENNKMKTGRFEVIR